MTNINNITFNRDISFMILSSDKGYHVYNLKTMAIVKSILEDYSFKSCRMLDKSSCQIFVSGGENPYMEPQNIVIWSCEENISKTNARMKHEIFDAYLEEKFIIIVTKNKILNLSNELVLIDSKTTYDNYDAICKLAKNKNIIATLGTTIGQIMVLDLDTKISTIIDAHNTNIKTISINNDGTLIATASEIGTIIRVFNNFGDKIIEFRRGTCVAAIYDLAFSNDNNFLVCCSKSTSTGTVHIWDLTDNINAKSMLSGLGEWISPYFGSKWPCKTYYLDCNEKMFCNFDENNILHVVSKDKYHYKISGAQYEIISAPSIIL